MQITSILDIRLSPLYPSEIFPSGRGCLSWLKSSWIVVVICSGFMLVPGQTEAAYAVTELATLPQESSNVVRGLNDAGEVVGSGLRRGGRQQGFLLSGGAVQPIVGPTIAGVRTAGVRTPDYSATFGINNSGETVGYVNTATGIQAFRSTRLAGYVALSALPGDNGSAALAINHPGDIVGYSSGPTGIKAVIWTRAGRIQALPGLPGSVSNRALAINDSKRVVGVSDLSSGSHAVLWANDAVRDLGTLPGDRVSEALGINSRGEIVGSSGDPNVSTRAVLWSPDGTIQALGALPGGTSSRALAISNRGEVVGTSHGSAGARAFLWTSQSGMQDLNDLLTSRAGFVLTQAVAVNAQGVILAIGEDEVAGEEEHHELPTRIFQLVPVP